MGEKGKTRLEIQFEEINSKKLNEKLIKYALFCNFNCNCEGSGACNCNCNGTLCNTPTEPIPSSFCQGAVCNCNCAGSLCNCNCFCSNT